MVAQRKFAQPTPRRSKQSPLDIAVTKRDSGVLQMVEQALRHKDCFLVYQPVVRTDCNTTVGFYEGLIRVLDDTGRIIPAGEFMPSVEDTELGREIDTWALKLGCQALHTHPELRLSINMSARSIGYQPWMKALNWWLRQNADIGPRLILEITEGSAMQMPEVVVDFMDKLQARGICFALDDFGSGSTALRYFKDFFFDIVKIDGQFIRGIATDVDNQLLTQAMNDIAHNFEMLTVAEMVETAEDAAFLTSLGVDCMQGFLFGAPSPRPDGLTDLDDEKRSA